MLKKSERSVVFRNFKKQWQLQVFVGLGLLYLVIFSWGPLFGWIIAFKDYAVSSGFPGFITSKWNNFRFFKEFFTYYRFWELFRNTVLLSVFKLVATFPAAILLALLIAEMHNTMAKKFFQTVSYLPYFISWILVYTIAMNIFGETTGILNQVLVRFQFIDKPIPYMNSADLFYPFTVFLSVWKTTGWSSIIFLAAITGVDTTLYESAAVDGAGRLARIWHITLPSILPAIVTVLIINIGGMLGGGMGGSNFEISQLFGNGVNSSTADIIQTYSFTMGLSKGRFAYATAVDMVQSLLSIILVVSSNWAAKKLSGESLF